MFDVTAIGELLIDFTPSGKNELGMALFARNPGGAPANVLAMNARLGGKTAFLGKVGRDTFGDFLRQTLVDSQIDVSGLVVDERVPTTLAFVQLDDRGDRTFSFYRSPGADLMLSAEELCKSAIEDGAIFHFGSVSLTGDPSRTANFEAAAYAKKLGKLISFDPNFRPLLWEDIEEAKVQMKRGASMADLIKVSLEELELLTGESDLAKGSALFLEAGAALVLVSLGVDGAYYRNQNASGQLHTYDVKTVDTTGAGDAFLGAVHYRLKGKSAAQLRELTKSELEDLVDFANAAGSLTTTKKGAIPAMPTLEEIEACRKKTPLL